MQIFCSHPGLLSNHAVLYTAAGVVLLKVNGDDLTPLLKTLHWLPISLRVKSKNLNVPFIIRLQLSPFPHWHPCCSLNVPNMVPLQGLSIPFPPAWRVLPRCPKTSPSRHAGLAPVSLSQPYKTAPRQSRLSFTALTTI